MPLRSSARPRDVDVTGGPIAERRAVVRDVTLRAILRKLEETRIPNFERVASGETGGFRGIYFDDSDVYKWLEAVATFPDAPADVLTAADRVIGLIEKAQRPDGYLNTYFQLEKPGMELRNLAFMHEIYCAGHLLEAAAAWLENRQDDRLATVAAKWHAFLAARIGPDAEVGYDGHEEYELALLRFAEATGDPAYADYTRWMVGVRGTSPSPLAALKTDTEAAALAPGALHLVFPNGGEYDGAYAQDHLPLKEQTDVVGHAVRAMYLYVAAARGSDDYRDALEKLWRSLVERRMYVTGGIGPSAANEGFTVDFDLPNLTAYAETCAACGLIFWAGAMGELTGESGYGDVLERALFNALPAGLSIEGDRFTYDTPLESRGRFERKEWFSCACCPPNLARLYGSVGRYLVQVSEWRVDLVVPFTGTIRTDWGGLFRLTTDYPRDGRVEILYEGPDTDAAFAFRIPDWADEIGVELPDDDAAEYDEGFAVCHRVWRSGDRAVVEFEMPPVFRVADPRVKDAAGRVCLTRGPVVYCVEGVESVSPHGLSIDPAEEVAVVEGPFGWPALRVAAVADSPRPTAELYPAWDEVEGPSEATATFVPYALWGNRGPTDMLVWPRSA